MLSTVLRQPPLRMLAGHRLGVNVRLSVHWQAAGEERTQATLTGGRCHWRAGRRQQDVTGCRWIEQRRGERRWRRVSSRRGAALRWFWLPPGAILLSFLWLSLALCWAACAYSCCLQHITL